MKTSAPSIMISFTAKNDCFEIEIYVDPIRIERWKTKIIGVDLYLIA